MGSSTFISWIDMEKEYVTNDDCIDVTIHAKIISITDEPCEMKTFALSHTIKNMSSIREGEDYDTDTQYRFNIPWSLKILNRNEFSGLFIRCEKQLCKSRKWSIETEYQLKIVSPNGRSELFGGTYVFDNPNIYGWHIIRWSSLEDRYIVNDTLTVEAQVTIVKMTGIEDETPIEKPSGIVIPVGNQEFSLERWMEMAFDH